MLVTDMLVGWWWEILNACITLLTVLTNFRHRPTNLVFLLLRGGFNLRVKTRHLRTHVATQ